MIFFQLSPPKQEPTTKSRQLFVSSSAPTAASSSSRQIHKTWQRVQLFYNFVFFLLQNQLSDSSTCRSISSLFFSDTHLQRHIIIIKKRHVITYWGRQAGRDLAHFFCVNLWKRKKSNKTIHEGLTGQVAFISFKRRFWFYLFEFNRSL